jgi:hypothetical protein
MLGVVSKLKLILKVNLSKLLMLGLVRLVLIKAQGIKISEITSRGSYLAELLISQASFPFAILTRRSFLLAKLLTEYY